MNTMTFANFMNMILPSFDPELRFEVCKREPKEINSETKLIYDIEYAFYSLINRLSNLEKLKCILLSKN